MPNIQEITATFINSITENLGDDAIDREFRQFADQAYRGRNIDTIMIDDIFYSGSSRTTSTRIYYAPDPISDSRFFAYEDQEKDWKQTKFVSGDPTPPSAAKRAKLRAKRKKKK